MHFVHTVCNHFIIYIKFNISMDEVNEVSQISHFSVFLLWITLFNQLSGKVANKCHQLQVYNFEFVLVFILYLFLSICFLSLRNVWINNDPLREGVVLNAKGRKVIYNGYQSEWEQIKWKKIKDE